MFTAKDMHAKREALNKCSNIDAWLEETLFKKFNQYGNAAIIDVSEITKQGWIRPGFEKELVMRGFHVEYKSDQRDGDYYRITYQVQEF